MDSPTEGCWTCRLRRKKCDEAKPLCGVCGALEITCVYGDQKPAWMDGGPREKAKAAELRSMVKAKAGERRDKKWAHELGAEGEYAVDDLDGMLSLSMAGSMALDGARGDSVGNGHSHSHGNGQYDGNSPKESSAVAVSGSNQLSDDAKLTDDAPGRSAQFPAAAGTQPPTSWLVDSPQERELTQAMLYLDYVFPFLNPFYQPALLAHGRGWLLVLLTRNRALYHAALSLASYFFAVVIENVAAGHESCRIRNWELLIQQQGFAAAALHADLAALDLAGLDHHQQRHLSCMENLRAAVASLNTMAHMLSFELAVGNAASGPAHLDAAAGLLDRLVTHASTGGAAPWHAILERLGPQDVPAGMAWPGGQRPWLSDEAAFRFVTAQLLWTDVLASTALGRPPRLQALHAELLEGPDPGLPMHEFVGVQAWAVALLGEVAALAAWVKTHQMLLLPADELTRRARDIEMRLEDGLEVLELSLPPEGDPNLAQTDPSAWAPGSQRSAPPGLPLSGPSPASTTPAHALHTLVYVRATLLYLTTVTHRWTASHPTVQRHHSGLVALLGALPGPMCLRTLVWPFAVAGCLASHEQEPFFRGLVAAMDEGLRVFGTIREALQVMTVVWEHRGSVEAADWGLAECLGVLGHVSLLV